MSPETLKSENTSEKSSVIPLDGSMFGKLKELGRGLIGEEKELFDVILLNGEKRAFHYTQEMLAYLSEEEKQAGSKPTKEEGNASPLSRFTTSQLNEEDSHQLLNTLSQIGLVTQGALGSALDIGESDSSQKTLMRFSVASLQYTFSALRNYRTLVDKKQEDPETALEEAGIPNDFNPQKLQSDFFDKIEKLPPEVRGHLLNDPL